MENQEKKGLQKITSNLMEDVIKEKLHSFSVLSTQDNTGNSVCGVIVGTPIDVITSLVVVMKQNKQTYNLLKTAIETFEHLQDSQPSSSLSVHPRNMEDLMNNLFKTIFNG